ncbi:MAG: hypothetical protein ACOWWM_17745 [Desulfobacterales bacterium]
MKPNTQGVRPLHNPEDKVIAIVTTPTGETWTVDVSCMSWWDFARFARECALEGLDYHLKRIPADLPAFLGGTEGRTP